MTAQEDSLRDAPLFPRPHTSSGAGLRKEKHHESWCFDISLSFQFAGLESFLTYRCHTLRLCSRKLTALVTGRVDFQNLIQRRKQ
jgi:hypothetical protein